MTEHLNIWVAGYAMVSIPLITKAQKRAADKLSLGARDGSVFILIESEPRKVIEV